MNNLKFFFFIIPCFFAQLKADYDLTLAGRFSMSDGLCRIPITFAEILHSDLKINFNPIAKGQIIFLDMPTTLKELILANLNNDKSKVLLYCDTVGYKNYHPTKKLPNSFIKIAYSMFESTKIPKEWIPLLNNNFDAVVVPDKYLIEVYERSGVKIPVFELPLPLYLDEFLNNNIKTSPNKIFTFGLTASFFPAKNQDLVIDAFAKAFKNNEYVQLLIHGRNAQSAFCKILKDKIQKMGITNIKIIETLFSQKELLEFMASLDCYVLLSRGEGFSITPREAMALGVPCILSNNTAHKTICDSDLVRPVPSNILVEANYEFVGLTECGHQFNCKIEDAAQALSDVYQNFSYYLDKAIKGKEWVKQYRHQNIKMRLLNLIKPSKVILSNKNEINDQCLITSSEILYKKYIMLQNP